MRGYYRKIVPIFKKGNLSVENFKKRKISKVSTKHLMTNYTYKGNLRAENVRTQDIEREINYTKLRILEN